MSEWLTDSVFPWPPAIFLLLCWEKREGGLRINVGALAIKSRREAEEEACIWSAALMLKSEAFVSAIKNVCESPI